MPQTPTSKQRTSVTIDAGVLNAARDLDLNVSAISEAAISEAVREASARRWAEENADALAERRAWIDAHGMPLADIQVFKPE